ncbi:MAG TPA: hypothetical protein VIY47_14005 [Ignavibacteriaceae bacterium]
MKTPVTKTESFNRGKLSLKNIGKYLSLIIGSVILLCMLTFIFIPDPFINTLLKDQITKAFTKAYPEYSIQIGEMYYSVWKNRLGFDSIRLKARNSTFSGNVASISVSGIGWIKILWKRDFTVNDLSSSVIDAQKLVFNFQKSQTELSIGMLHISAPDSELTADSIKYHPSVDDEHFFAKSQFRQTRFRFDISQLKIMGLDFSSLLQRGIYNTRNININGVFADILVNKDKSFDVNSTNPQMPNDALLTLKKIIKVDSLNILNGRLKYCERIAIGATPGVITLNNITASVSGITNDTAHPDTAVINAEGIFMNSGTMKLFMIIPLTSKDFSLQYYGSLSTMDATKLNSFIEPVEHHRIKSGIIRSATYNISVNSGHATGSLKVVYKDLSIAVLNKATGSEKGIYNRISSFIGKTFVIRESNKLDEKGLMIIGEIKYTRMPDEPFLQFVWFALRSGIGNVVGF